MNLFKKNKTLILASLCLFFLGLFLFVPLLGHVRLFDWDEINFAEAAREMLVTQDFLRVQIDYEPFWEKPPLFIWFQAASMGLWGVNEFAARFPNALCGACALVVLFLMGFDYKKSMRFGFIWAGIYAVSFLPFFYFKTGLIDPWYNLFAFASFWLFFRCPVTHAANPSGHMSHHTSAWVSGVLCGCALLTKGPAAAVCLGAASWVMAIRWWSLKNVLWISTIFAPKRLLFWGLGATVVSSSWYLVDVIVHGPWFVTEFLKYQIRLLTTPDAGHGGPFYFHAVAIFLGCFPSSIFALCYLFERRAAWVSEVRDCLGVQRIVAVFSKGLAVDSNPHDQPRAVTIKSQAILFFVVFILFSVVKTKIVHYASLTYYPLTFFSALWLFDGFIEGKKPLAKAALVGVTTLGLLFAIALGALPLVGANASLLLPYVRDPVAREALNVPVNWTLADAAPAVTLASGTLGAWFLHRRRRLWPALVFQGGAIVIALQLSFWLLFPKIEAIAQGSVIDFYTSKVDCDCFIDVSRFKSFAQLFYTQKKPNQAASAFGMGRGEWNELLKAPAARVFPLESDPRFGGRPIYMVAKIHKADDLLEHEEFELMDSRGGFLFFKRVSHGKSE